MRNSNATNSHGCAPPETPQDPGLSPWQRLKTKRISYLTLPLIVMATVVEFVILATGWRYQQVVCLPQGMKVIFFGIGPIGATILAVELLKLPLAIWTASRSGWQKGFMLIMGLPLICVLTFQLVKDMAVYEMGVALTPASEMLEKAATQEIRILQLKDELANQIKDEGAVKAAIEEKRADRDRKLAALTAKQARAKAELEDSLKRNDATRQDAVTLTDYQKKELSESEARQNTIIRQFDADAEQLTKAITDLRARRETELTRANAWNAEEARIENAYKAKMAAYTNKKTAFEKAKAEYDNANFLKRHLMREPVDPGVPPERESNKILKPTLVSEIEAQIQAREAELTEVNNKRRDRVAQVEADARRLREEFDRRSGVKREESDHKREELLAAMALLVKEEASEAKAMDQEFEAAVQKEQDALRNRRPLEAIRAELDASRKAADGFYEAREAAIRNTQVHRIATTVEIVRGWLFGEHPISITATPKERGDRLTDQISMVRIWVYPVLAFIVAFLPTLMVEIGFSTLFHPERQRPPYRMGFLGRRLHWLYTRAGRQKILRAERTASEACAGIADRDQALAAARAAGEKSLAGKEAELQAAREALVAAAAGHDEQSKQREERHRQELKTKEDEWTARFSGLTESLNHALAERDTLRDFQQAEIERQVQLRQVEWSDRLAQLRQELENQRAAGEAGRAAMAQEHQRKLLEVSEDWKAQLAQARRQLADAELAGEEKSAKLSHDLTEALTARDATCSQLQLQVESLSLKLARAREDAAREIEKGARQEKHRLDRQQSEFAKTLRQAQEEFERRLNQREQELSGEWNTRLAQERTRAEQETRRREEEFERQLEARILEVNAGFNRELQQRDGAAQTRLQQREKEIQAQADARLRDLQGQADEQSRHRESELERQREAQSREAEMRFREELQQRELDFHARLKQRELELTGKAADRERELQTKWASELSAREEEWTRQTESRVRAAETRLAQEAQQQEEILQIRIRQREQQSQSQFDARLAELKAQWDQELHAREQEWKRQAETAARATESRWLSEMQQKEELQQSRGRQRDQQWQARLDTARAEWQAQAEQELRRREAESADARARALRELEAQLRKEMRESDEAARAEAQRHEQDRVAQLNAQAEAHQSARKEWETELETMRRDVDSFKALLARTEKERDEARQSASERADLVQDLEEKLMEASSFLTSWKNGKHSAAARAGKDALQAVHAGSGVDVES